MAPVASPQPTTVPKRRAEEGRAEEGRAEEGRGRRPRKAAPKKAPAKKSAVRVDPQNTKPERDKVQPSVTVAETGSFSFNAADTDIAHPIAAALLAVDGVVGVFGVNDFITVSGSDDAGWDVLLPAVVTPSRAVHKVDLSLLFSIPEKTIPRLVILNQVEGFRIFDIEKETVVIGRGEDADQYFRVSVSRHHAQFSGTASRAPLKTWRAATARW